MAAGMALVTILAAAALTGPYISRLIVDNVIQGGQHELMGPLIGLLVGLVVVKGVCRVTSQVLFETSSQGVLFMMRDKVYRKLLQEDFAFYNKNRTGDLMSRQIRIKQKKKRSRPKNQVPRLQPCLRLSVGYAFRFQR